jgi:hypothetical protein
VAEIAAIEIAGTRKPENVIPIHPEPIPATSTSPEFIKEAADLKFTAIGENLKFRVHFPNQTHNTAANLRKSALG